MNNKIVHFFLILTIGLLAYSNTFNSPFVFDDVSNIVENPLVKDLSYFADAEKVKPFTSNKYFQSRIAGFFTFAINYRLNSLNVIGYHLVNLAVHLINALLVYQLVQLTFYKTLDARLQPAGMTANGNPENPPSPPFAKGGIEGFQNFIALFSALLFVSHPLQTQAVTYIVQRFTSLATMFYLASLVLYVKSRISPPPSPLKGEEIASTGWNLQFKSIVFYFFSILSAILAMKTKEIAFTLPIIIVLYEFMFFKEGTKKRLVFVIPVLITLFIIPATLLDFDKPIGELLEESGEITRLSSTTPRLDYLFTEFRVIVSYLRLLILPIGQNLDYDYPLFHSFFDPSVLLSFLFLSSILGIGIYYFSRNRLISFGIFWFFATLTVESSVIPIADVIFEHRVYLPSIGFFIAVVAFVYSTFNRTANNDALKKLLMVFFIFIITGLTVLTYMRNTVWQSNLSLWGDVIKKSPSKARSHYNFARAYEKAGFINNAVEHYEIAVRLKPDYAEAHNNLGILFYSKGQLDGAIKYLEEASRYFPGNPDIHYNLGIAYFSKGLLAKAKDQYEITIRLDSNHSKAFNNLGNVCLLSGDIDKAIEYYSSAIKLNPGYSKAYANLSAAYRKKGLIELADNYQMISDRLNRVEK